MSLSHRQARRRFDAALDTAHYYRRKPEFDRELTEHLAKCPDCRAYTEQAAGIDAQLAQHLPQTWQAPSFRSQEIDEAVRKVHKRARRNRMIRRVTTTSRRAALLVGTLALIAGLVFILNYLLIDHPVPLDNPTSTAAAPVAENNEKVTITFASVSGSETLYETLIDEFETEHPDIDIQLIPVGEEVLSLEELVTKADVVLVGSAISSSDSQLFLDLAPLMASEDFAAQELWPGALRGCQAGDEQKGLPVHLGPMLVLYNKAVFDQAGVAYPQPSWSWDDFQAVVQALSDPDGEPPRYGFLAPNPVAVLGPFIAARLESGQGAAGLASDLEWYVELFRAGSIAGGDEAQQNGSALIRKGQAAMWLGTLSTLASDYQGLGFEVGAAPYPADAQAAATTSVNVSCAAISAGTRNPAASWAWLDFLSQNPPPDAGSYFAPANITAAEANGYWQQLQPETAQTVRYALEHGWFGWVQSDLSPVGEALTTAITSDNNLEDLLAEALPRLAVQVELPATQNTPVAVVPPTPTQPPAAVPPEALSAVYFANPDYHTSPRDVLVLAEEFNRTHPDMYIEIATERIGFENVRSNMFDVNNFDCFAAPIGVINNVTYDPSEDLDFAGKVYTLDPLLEASGTELLNDLNPILVDAARLDGSLYGLPVAIQPYVVYYNASLLEELGLEPPGLDWTREDFWALASEAASRGTDVYGYVPHGTEPLYFLSDVNYLDRTQSWPEASFDSPEVIKLLNQLAPFVEDRTLFLYESGGTRTPTGNYQERDEIMQFDAGALWIDTTGMPFVTHTPDEIGVAILPIQQSLDLASSTSLYISRRAKNPQVCWEWIKFLNEQPVSVFQGIPLHQSIMESDSWAASVGEQRAEVYRTTMANLKFASGNRFWPPMPLSQWWNDALVAVLQEGQDPKTVLRAIQYKAQATLDCMKAAGVTTSLPYEQSYEVAVSCAHQSDPDYYSVEELWKLQATP